MKRKSIFSVGHGRVGKGEDGLLDNKGGMDGLLDDDCGLVGFLDDESGLVGLFEDDCIG